MRAIRITTLVLVTIVLLVAGTATEWATDYVVLVLFQIFQLAALAQAWSLLAGYGGVVSLATSAFVGTGAYSAAEVSAHAGFGLVGCLLVGGVTAMILALVVSVPMFRFRGLYFTIASLVLAAGLALFVANSKLLGGNQGIVLGGSAPDPFTIYRLSFGVFLVTAAVVWWIRRSRLGLGLMAIRDDEDVALRMGVPVFRTKLLGFVFAAAVMGVVGSIQALRIGYIEPGGSYTINWTIDTVNAAIIGGASTVAGPLVGSVVAVVISELTSDYAQVHLLITGVVLILVIRLAPAGLWGTLARYLRRAGYATPLSRGRVPVRVSVGGTREATDRTVSDTQPVTPLMQVVGVGKNYGGVPAVNDVSFDIAPGEVLGIVGPNGAGKSTLIGLLSGAVQGVGVVHLDGQDVTPLDARTRTQLGVARTHQVPRPFEQLTVLENLLVARRHRSGGTYSEDLSECLGILDLCGLLEFADTLASDLGLLRLKRLELARALSLKPRLLLLDEIGAGLVKSEVDELIELIAVLRTEIESIVIVEHVLDVIRQCCDRLVVVNRGEKLLEGTPADVLADDRVAEVYLGTASEVTPTSGPARTFAGTLLSVREIDASYGKHRAVDGVSFEVGDGEIVALLGANGAGKSSVAKVIGGTLPLSGGAITFDGKPLPTRTHDVVRSGIAHCMEGRRIFADLTVEENLLLGARAAAASVRAERLEGIYELFPDLRERRTNSGAGLSGGQQQMLAVGRALMSAPRLIIFDEISLGLAPITVDRLYAALREINRTGVSMVVIEQDVNRGLALADRVVVLEKGAVALDGTPEQVRQNPELRTAYVG